MTRPADRLALDRAIVTQPVWNRFDTAGDVAGLSDNVLLHAGPLFSSPDHIPKPVLNSACVAAVYERLAQDFEQANAMIHAEEILLRPAQDYAVVVPLAAVISASMPLHSVYDAWGGKLRCFAPINGGPRPSLRLGICDMAVLDHVRWLNTEVRDVLQDGIGEGIGLVEMAAAGLKAGDDCHGYTPAAGAALVQEIHARSRMLIASDVAQFLASAPSLFLNLWMAATKLMMRAAEGTDGAGLITAAGGNGRDIGIQVAGRPGQWFTAPATPPIGDLGSHPASKALGAIGDSAIIDCFGLGAMAFANAPMQKQAMLPYCPDGFDLIAPAISTGTHPYLHELEQKIGCSVFDVVDFGQGPVISLGVIDRDGELGRLGGGLSQLPIALCAQAVAELAEQA